MNFHYIKSLWGKVCPLNTSMWGTYHRYHKHTPLCIMPHCYKYSAYRFTDTGCVEHYCEYHAGQVGTVRITRMWEVIEQWEAQQREDYEA